MSWIALDALIASPVSYITSIHYVDTYPKVMVRIRLYGIETVHSEQSP